MENTTFSVWSLIENNGNVIFVVKIKFGVQWLNEISLP